MAYVQTEIDCARQHGGLRYESGGCVECQREATKRKKSAGRSLVTAIKMERGCGVCGYCDHPAALGFHHRDPATKEFAVGAGVGRSEESLLNEISKCVVLCANCHARLHWGGE